MNTAKEVLRALSIKPEEHIRRALGEAWDDGYSACAREFDRQAKDPSYPIGRKNPHAAKTSLDAAAESVREFVYRMGG